MYINLIYIINSQQTTQVVDVGWWLSVSHTTREAISIVKQRLGKPVSIPRTTNTLQHKKLSVNYDTWDSTLQKSKETDQQTSEKEQMS